MKKIEYCDCLIGFLCGKKINMSTIYYEVLNVVDAQLVLKKHGLLKGEPLIKNQIVDNRKGYLSRFIFCPYCGEKINWKQIISSLLIKNELKK